MKTTATQKRIHASKGFQAAALSAIAKLMDEAATALLAGNEVKAEELRLRAADIQNAIQ